jgi:thioredoxin-like negative regulator of GroEL
MAEASLTSLAAAQTAMQRAVALARAGEHRLACAEATAALPAGPQDVNLLHQAGVVHLLGGDHAEALRLFHAALAVVPDFHFTQIEIANTLVAMDRGEEAADWYLSATRSAPTYALGWRRAGAMLHRLGHPARALDMLRQAHGCDPTDPEAAAELADLLVFHDQRAAAADVYGPVMAAGRMRLVDWRQRLTLLSELGQYGRVVAEAAALPEAAATSLGYDIAVLAGHAALALTLDRPSIVAAARARQHSGRWLDPQGVVAALRQAIAARRPTSLVRVGDGEARFLAYADPALRGRLSAVQAELLGDVPFRNWFGLAIADADRWQVARLQAASVMAMEQADILGVTAADRLATDGFHFGYLGHLEGLIASVAHGRPEMRLTDAMVHLDLHRAAPFYGGVLAGIDFLGVVSPHPGLAERLARHHGIRACAEYLLPGESRLPGDKQNRREQPHFPDLYHELYRRIDVPYPGAVFLVAGGMLGKIYCTWIRQRGGIAIDAGSVVDAWMGFNTRPGLFDRPDEWLLPGATAAEDVAA